MDISAPSPISAQATLAAHAPVREPPAVAQVDPSPASDGTRMDSNTANGEGRSDLAQDARQRLAHQERLEDPKTPTGPPPTFQITLLEVEQDLHNILARLEMARSKERDADGVRPDVSKDAAQTSSELQNRAPNEARDVPSSQSQQLNAHETARSATARSIPVVEPEQLPAQTSQQAATLTRAPATNDGMPV